MVLKMIVILKGIAHQRRSYTESKPKRGDGKKEY
jgi:hypothetical protein